MIRIITDSSIDISKDLKERVQQIPLTVSFGEEEYLDGVDLSKDEFYTRLEKASVLPVTSQIPPARFQEVFQKVTENGDSALVLCLSSKLSGTYQSACIAAEDFDNIRVVDTLNVTIGGGILVQYAVNCLDQGMDLDQLTEAVEEKKGKIQVVATLDTLKYLEKGGRISKAVAFAGGVLNVKPAIEIKDGEVVILGKVRGAKNSSNFLIQKINEKGVDYDLPILAAYSGISSARLDKYIEDSRDLWEGKVAPLERVQLCTVVGTHIGSGAIAVSFFSK